MAKRKGKQQLKKDRLDPVNWAKEKYYPAGKPTIKRLKKHTGRKK